MSTKSNEVKTTVDQMPAYIKQGQSRGNENVSQEDLSLPRIDLLQALSPHVNKKKEEYIEGAEPGMLYNTLTGELYKTGVRVTFVTFTKRFLVWVNRKLDSEGGLRGVFDTEAEAEQYMSEQEDENKLELVPTAEHLVILDDGTEAILSMAKSKMKVSRKLNSLIRLNGGDRFGRSYQITSVGDKSAQGEFENLKVTLDGYPSEDVYNKAEKLYTAITSGSAKQKAADYTDAKAPEGKTDKEAEAQY